METHDAQDPGAKLAPQPQHTISCIDVCGRRLQFQKEDEILDAAWSWLSIRQGWRCPACWRELRAAGSMRGTDGVTLDALDPKSRGALPKATADTISAPVVGRNSA